MCLDGVAHEKIQSLKNHYNQSGSSTLLMLKKTRQVERSSRKVSDITGLVSSDAPCTAYTTPGVVQALSYILSDHTDALIVSLFEVWRSSQGKERLGLGLPSNFGLGGRSNKSSSSDDFGVAAGFPGELCHYTLLFRWLWPSMR